MMANSTEPSLQAVEQGCMLKNLCNHNFSPLMVSKDISTPRTG